MSFTNGMNGVAPSTPNTFEHGGHKYMSLKMNCFQQFHVIRKLGPLLARIGPSFMNAPAMVSDGVDPGPTNVLAEMLKMEAFGPMMEALSAMSEDDCNYVLEHCLGVTRRLQEPGGVWVTVFNMQAHRLQFEDIDLMAMMQITVRVLGDNLSNFSLGDEQNTAGPSTTQNGPSSTSPFPTVKII